MRMCVQTLLRALGLTCMLVGLGCGRTPKAAAPPSTPSEIKVDVQSGGPAIITTHSAEFRILPSGYIQAFLLKRGQRLTLDDPGEVSPPDSDFVVSDTGDIHFTLDFAQATIKEALGRMGPGKMLEIPARPLGPAAPAIEQTLQIEVYDDFPGILLSSAQYKNTGDKDLRLGEVVAQQHRLNAGVVKDPAYDMWSFQGSSYDWGEDDVVKLASAFYRPNLMGEQIKGGYGGGIPVAAFWNASVGEAIGHVETLPLTLSIPVRVEKDARVNAKVSIPAGTLLKPGDTFSTPRTFLSVYSGDFYQPLRMWSSVLQKEGWELPKPSSEAYNVSWCGWGYESDVTPAQMLGTVPKLKEFNIKWATLDDRWFNNYGDWNPRADTFPGDSAKKMVDDFHRQGILVQLWWLPIAVEDGQGRYGNHRYDVADVVKQHPDWLILDKNGKHARTIRDLAAFCPAVPEVEAYYRELTARFIRDWGFDGSKLDNIYSVPACYNPAHHHKSPQDSVNAMANVYKGIYEVSRALKPQSVTQSCPCGTPPSLAWLPFLDQAVTADPVGGVQVRRRIKMYKALLGPESAVYGDHVELSAMTKKNGDWIEHGDDFASTIGPGGVVGTKFVWPDPGPKFQRVTLTAEKEEHWKKWIGIYNQKMLSKGAFRDLYTYGYDTPEGYAIEKEGKMYYAFFAPTDQVWKGEIELRGLNPGSYHVRDYAEGKDFGTVQATPEKQPILKTEFKDHLLLEVSQ